MEKSREFQLEDLAQMAGEERLRLAVDLMVYDNEHWDDENASHPGYDILADPFCGCDTCVVREVIDAAWPYLKTLALIEAGYEPT